MSLAIDSTQPLVLLDNPLAVIDHNDRYRIHSVMENDLWTIDQLASADRLYRYFAPTFVPQTWSKYTPIKLADYIQRINQKFSIIREILPIPHVYIAGGCAAWPLGPSEVTVGDIDFFIAGIPGSDRAALWRTVSIIATKVRAFATDLEGSRIVETLTPGVITMQLYHLNYYMKLQIILRAFPSLSSILHGFDVPSCCIAYDGRQVYMTYLAAWAHAFRANIVWPAYQSTTYERRLIKYFSRGYALVIPLIRRDIFVKDIAVKLPHLILTPIKITPVVVIGILHLNHSEPDSDYIPNTCIIPTEYQNELDIRFTSIRSNVRQLVSETHSWRISRIYPSREGDDGDLPAIQHDFMSYILAEPRLSSFLSEEQVRETLLLYIPSVVNAKGIVNVGWLRDIFRLNKDQIMRVIDVVLRTRITHPHQSIDLSPTLLPICDEIVATYNLMANVPIDWWIIEEPSRQYTVSRDLRLEDPMLWYGGAVGGEPCVPSHEMIMKAEKEREVSSVPIYDGTCMICHDVVHIGDINSIIIHCGHIFHWAVTDSCMGFRQWSDDHITCPVCRQSLNAPGKLGLIVSDDHELQPVQISLVF